MKAIFYNYQTEDGEREDVFTTEIDIIPLLDHDVSFPWGGDIHFASIKSIYHCFGLDGKFSHIDIEIGHF